MFGRQRVGGARYFAEKVEFVSFGSCDYPVDINR